MAGDRVVINSLERAVSNDINDLQAMAARRFADLVSQLCASRAIVASGGPVDTYVQSCTSGLEARAVGAFIEILPGILMQSSLTWPAAPGALESIMRIGMQRSTAVIPIPAVASTFMILEARVVDVTTVTATRDVFDVPTQTFIPTLLNKQIERQIEYQIVQGSTTQLPGFSGDPWVPLFGFITDGAGTVLTLPSAYFWDMRPDFKDLSGDLPARFTPDTDHPETVVECWALHSRTRAAGFEVGGNYMARTWFGRAWLKADDGALPVADNGVTGLANTQEQLYLCPLSSNGVTIWPIAQIAGLGGTTRGAFVRSFILPGAEGPDNSGAITFDPAGLYGNFDVVPTKRAAYCGTVHVDGTAAGYVAFTQSSGGKYLSRPIRTSGSPVVNVANRALAALVGTETHALDLRGIAPACARTLVFEISIETSPTGASTDAVLWFLRRNGEATQTWPSGRVDSGNTVIERVQIEVPCHESSLDTLLLAQYWELVITAVGSPNCALQIDCSGWSF